MGLLKRGLDEPSDDSDQEDHTNMSDDDSDSNTDLTSDSDSDSDSDSANAGSSNKTDAQPAEKSNPDGDEEEEEDEVIKAIRKENERERDHPPVIHCDDFIVDISFHPDRDLLGVASITGDVLLYKYTNDENTLLNTLELHTQACRDIEFNEDGRLLYSVSKDKSIMVSDVETGKLETFYEKAHEEAIYCLTVLDENLFATGDDDGVVKLWDKRVKDKQIFRLKKNEDYISDLISNDGQKYLLCSSGDGSLTTIDLQQRQFFMQSEEYDEELTCLGIFRSETKLIAGSSKGRILLFNWNEFGLHSDIFPGQKCTINSMIPITENIVVTACEDGVLRATHIFPHRHLGIVGQHELSVENVDICNNGRFIASTSHNNDIKFWNIQYFEDFEKLSHKHNKHNKRKEMENNLPSSKRQNVSDFFSDLN